jgi:sigma-B regulation protein RsbU (phosphoserine phosphatase)
MDKSSRISVSRFPARAYQLKQIRCIVQKAMTHLGCEERVCDEIVLAINEACMNIIQHAYAGDSSGEILLEIYDEGTQVMFRLTDFAAPVDECTIKSRNLDDVKPGGLGVHIIHEVMDSVEFKKAEGDTGNILELRKTVQCQQNPGHQVRQSE